MANTRGFRALLAAACVLAGLMVSIGGCHRAATTDQGYLRYAMKAEPTQLDPSCVEDGDTIDLLQQVFEGLVRWTEKDELAPNLAERWDVSADGKTYTFHLKPGVRFHNGRLLTADDFVFTITRTLCNKQSSVAATYLGDILGAQDALAGRTTTVRGVRAVDPATLQIETDRRRPYFLSKLTYPTAYVVCREACPPLGQPFTEKAMVGTGPFKLGRYERGYRVTLEANAQYHGGKPLLRGIVRPIMPDTTARQTAYESGRTDYTDVQLSDLARIRKDPALGKQIHEYARPAIWYLAMNPAVFKPFQDRRVRRAIAQAIDKPALIRLALKDMAQPASGILPPGIPGHDETYRGLPYDVAAARQQLAEAGYPGGKGFPRLLISFKQGEKQIEDTVLAIRSDLQRNLGIQVDARAVEWGQFLTERSNRTMPCYHVRWMADYFDPQNFLSLMLRTGAQENGVRYSNPRFDALCDAADVEGDQGRRIALYRQAERIAVEDAPWVCIYYQRDIELQKPGVQGIRNSRLGHLPHLTTVVTR